LWWQHYLPRLTSDLKDQIETTLLTPTGMLESYRKTPPRTSENH
jgi:hypothetical protein